MASTVCDFRHAWTCSSEPPYTLNAEFKLDSEEVLATMADDRWLFPPAAGPSSRLAGATEQRALRSAAASHPPGPAAAARPHLATSYEFMYLKSEIARSTVDTLLSAASQPLAHSDSRARRVGSALETFAVEAFRAMQPTVGCSPEERQYLLPEAVRAMRFLVETDGVNVATDLVLCLEAFGVGKGRPARQQEWLCASVKQLLRAALEAGKAADAEHWRQLVKSRMRSEASELYGIIDVRAWPHILDLCKITDFRCIDGESFKAQVRFQLCNHGEIQAWTQGLLQAAKLLADLRQMRHFVAEEVREIFNNREHFDRHNRQTFLLTCLRGAPRSLVQAVLEQIDGNDTDASDRDDEEMILVRELIKQLREDIRCCPYAFYKMKSEWVAGRYSGVVTNEELSPEQICDHIEDECNYENLLRSAVNKYLRNDRKFEAARMLARRASQGTRVFETNRNDKQLAYLISLYQDVQPLEDRFGPVEANSLVLPCSWENVLYIDDCDETLDQLERVALLDPPIPVVGVVGVWWFWRCFDPNIDFWAKASFMTIAFKEHLFVVDFIAIEDHGADAERRAKDVVCRILSAPHLLKVMHDLDTMALSALQRALVPIQSLMADDPPVFPGITPMVDISVVVAFVRRTRPCSPAVSRLTSCTFDFLRLELCLAEALSNFERRPLRKTQVHYALTLAWCPLMILRVLCAHGVLVMQQVTAMAFRVGFPDTPHMWDESLRKTLMCRPGQQQELDSERAGEESCILGTYGVNTWEDPQWRESVPKPDPDFEVATCFRKQGPRNFSNANLETMALPASDAEDAHPAFISLLDSEIASRNLNELYEAYRMRWSRIDD